MNPHRSADSSLVTKLLSEAGELAQLWPGYQSREEQLGLSQQVERAISERRSMLIEAPTGTGKTLGYLLAAMTSPDKIILSVGNRTLQDHLWWGEYQKLQLMLPQSKSMQVLKGCDNYLCNHKIQQSLETGHPLLLEVWDHINQWRLQTRSGDLQTLPPAAQEKLTPLRRLISVSADQCLGKACAWFDHCFFQLARSKAAESELLLINHSLLLSDQQLFDKGLGALLPEAAAVIVDEAHQLPDMLVRHNMEMIDGYRLQRWLTKLRRQLGDELRLFSELTQRLDQLGRVWQQIETQLSPAFESQDLLAVSSRSVQPLLDIMRPLQQYLEHIQGSVANIKEYLAQLTLWVSMLSRTIEESGLLYCERSGNWMRVLAARLNTPFTGLRTSHISWVFLSATLAVGDKFDFVKRSLMLPEMDEYRFKGAMDYRKQARLWVPESLPDPANEHFYSAWTDTLLELATQVQGGMLLLFSSHKALQVCAELLRGRTERTILVYEPESNRQQLLQHFRQDQNSLLLATGSFWEGIDIQGPALRCVAIDKLPFSPPDDLMNLAWRHMARQQQRHWFNDFAVPQAITRLRQGVGRLLRAPDDDGLVVVGDRRLLRKAYGGRFLAALPDMARVESLAEAIAFLEAHQINGVNT